MAAYGAQSDDFTDLAPSLVVKLTRRTPALCDLLGSARWCVHSPPYAAPTGRAQRAACVCMTGVPAAPRASKPSCMLFHHAAHVAAGVPACVERSVREAATEACEARACTSRTQRALRPPLAYFHHHSCAANGQSPQRRTTRHVMRVSGAHAPLTTRSPRRTLAAHCIRVVYTRRAFFL
jgi:hypothetical protein